MFNYLKNFYAKLCVALLFVFASSLAIADDNGGTTLDIPTYITGDTTAGTLGYFELLMNTIEHYAYEYVMPLLLLAISIGWVFWFIFYGSRRGKQGLSS